MSGINTESAMVHLQYTSVHLEACSFCHQINAKLYHANICFMKVHTLLTSVKLYTDTGPCREINTGKTNLLKKELCYC